MQPGFSAPPPVETPDDDELTLEAPLPPAEPVAQGRDDADDELMLGADAVVPEPPAPAPASEPSIRRRWLTGGSDEDAAPAAPAAETPKPKSGGTLFERMAAARGGSKDDDGDKDPLDIPRFLNRQNNQ